jgi:hypothetical protein
MRMQTHWKVEVFTINRRWLQIGFPDNEAEAIEIFERAVHDYPGERMIRIREGEAVRAFRPAEGQRRTV